MNMGTVWRVLTRKKVIDADAAENTRLARVLNTFDLTALGVGSTLGVGVYVLAGHVARDTAGPSVVLSFLIAAIASVFAGLCYAEFGARTPRAGSAYVYSYVCVGEFIAFVIGWNLILEYVIGSASVARGLTLYLDTLINNTLQNTFIDIAPINVSFLSAYFDFFSFGITILLTVGLAFGMKESTWLNNLFTIMNIFVVLFVIIAGSLKADPENWNVPANVSDERIGEGGFFPFGVEGMIRGAATCFYGFVGFDCIATTGEEVKNPRRAIPIAIILSLMIIFLSYFGTATVITMMVPFYAQDINAPIPHAFEEVGWTVAKWIVAIGGIFGLCASLFGAMFPLPRIIYAMASDGLIFKFLGSVSSRFSTPVIGTMLAGLLTGLMSALFELRQLVNMMSIGTLMAYTIVAACVLLLRYSDSTSTVNNSTINTDSQVEDANNDSRHLINDERITFSSSFKQLFNGRGLRSPSRLTERLAAIHIAVFCFIALLLGLCAMFLVDDIQHGKVYAIVLTSIVGFLIILVLMSLSMQPTSNQVLSFKVPLVPLIPALSILINIYLMLMLDASTWIRFGIWMLIGLLIYILSIRSYPHARNTVISNKSVANGHLNGNAKSNGMVNNIINDEMEEKTNSMGDSGIESYAPKTPTYDSIKSINTIYVDPPRIIEGDLQAYHEKKSISSIDVALGLLDDVLTTEELASQSVLLNVDVPSRKASIDTMSVASNVPPTLENVVALVHREDVVSKPASPIVISPNLIPQDPLVNNEQKQNKAEDNTANELLESNNNAKDVLFKEQKVNEEKDGADQEVSERERQKHSEAEDSATLNVNQSFEPEIHGTVEQVENQNSTEPVEATENLKSSDDFQNGKVQESIESAEDLKLSETTETNNVEVAAVLSDKTNEDQSIGSDATVSKDEPVVIIPPIPPPPPPMEDFINHKISYIKPPSDSSTSPKPTPQRMYIKQKQPSPSPIREPPEESSPQSRRPSENYVNDDNVAFGSNAFDHLKKKLNVILKSRGTKLTKPEVHPPEELPAKSNTLKPVMSQIISEIIKANTSDDESTAPKNDVPDKKEPIEEKESVKKVGDEEESGVDTRPVAPSDIRKRLNEIFRSDPRATMSNLNIAIRNSPKIDRNRGETPPKEQSKPNTNENKSAAEIKQQHQEKMGDVFATIRLRKADSIKND